MASYLKKDQSLGWTLIVIVNLIAICFLPSHGTADVDGWLGDYSHAWLPNALKHGVVAGYARAADNYPPLSYLLIAAVGHVSRVFGVDLLITFKCLVYAFLVGSMMCAHLIFRNLFYTGLMGLFLLINPMGLGYIDVLFVPFVFLALYFAREKKWPLASLSFALAVNMKYQPLIIAPIFALYTWLELVPRVSTKNVLRWFKLVVGPVLVLELVLLLIFKLWTVFSLYLAFTGHPTLSANSLNFNWIVMWILNKFSPDEYRAFFWGTKWHSPIPKLLFVTTYATCVVSLYCSKKNFESFVRHASAAFMCYCMLNVGVHENHMYLLIPLLGVLAVHANKHFATWLFWSFAAEMNLVLFYGLTGSRFEIFRDLSWESLLLSGANVIAFAIFFFLTVRETFSNFKGRIFSRR